METPTDSISLEATQDSNPGEDAICFTAGAQGVYFGAGVIHAYLAAEHAARDPAPVADNAAWLVVCVADDGIGIAPQDQEQLFTRFYRVNNPVALRAGGTGLGLSITRSLVELHGGRIWYQSQPGSGSIFCFSLPAQPRIAERA